MNRFTPDETITELDYRESNGIAVSLRWSRSNNRLSIVVEDLGHGQCFTLAARPDNALDIFHHPYAYAPLAA